VARAVAKLVKKDEQSSQYMSGVVIKVIATFTKFINHFSRKKNETVICDIPFIGQFILEDTFDFLPSQFFSNEIGIAQSNRKNHLEGILKKELTVDRIANLC
jgi:hypothetical protein